MIDSIPFIKRIKQKKEEESKKKLFRKITSTVYKNIVPISVLVGMGLGAKYYLRPAKIETHERKDLTDKSL